ncbi:MULTISPECIES: ABC transporter ATP-binding protein [Pseudoalteromonas]|uniref:ABC-type antimicrobial peptide transport system, ATPase component n=1 Tax=Pseudoalteromonas luteoviolacea (strain 2ta16) TaxID=1353533 RepID=V4JKR9_PSEL2|nr:MULTISPECIES: ABC transporter ATP-binding protein [Pseudoalteromonas]ESP95442.1 ABC-type antimicrobial peptide transport system, ATPase component [Pseudoalteromonas luteoviolacea 2ta16]KZN31025.1 ABC transporter [Pseudoalteromonas luteoviolacea NCIMB 1944]MCG7548417.1 ABC transporter ATP-binding protein [Pseudoalteromonas sp. Of7M-16]
MLKFSSVTKNYEESTVVTQALQPFNLQVASGDFIALVGPSGSGKTTFLNIAGLLESPSSGEYTFLDKDVKTLSDKQKSRLRSSDIGFVFQSFHLLPELNVYDNVEIPLRYSRVPAKQRRASVMSLLEQVGLCDRINCKPNQLSGGQQQRVAIARALVGKPSLILADEPTGNLDSKNAADIMAILSSFNQCGTTILMVTHSLKLALQAKRTIEIRDGILKERCIEHYAARWG